MRIVHVSAECYPAAKAGGLGDVVGALPKYLNRHGHEAAVVIPKYRTDWIHSQKTETVFSGQAPYGLNKFDFSIEKVRNKGLGYDLFFVNIPGKFDREGIYSDPWSGLVYWDEMDRSFCFQIAVLEWIGQMKERPEVVHCHDHHTALLPFMMTRCYRYDSLNQIPTVLTIHNGEYQGRYDRYHYTRLPAFNLDYIGLLDWDGELNSLAAGIKCAWHVTTVSRGYLNELMNECHGLEELLIREHRKMSGLINGIDVEVWDPETDPHLVKNYTLRGRKTGKRANREYLEKEFDLEPGRPLLSFIGRLAKEKGADMLPALIDRCRKRGMELNIIVLGTGEPALHKQLSSLQGRHAGYYNTRLEYNESLAHKIYAGSDFLIMPSRVEPCGLNQMYAMRYGTLPIVRATGGLADTVVDISDKNGYGLLFRNFDLDEAIKSISRAVDFHSKEKNFSENRKRLMKLDFSWEKASEQYEQLYKQLT